MPPFLSFRIACEDGANDDVPVADSSVIALQVQRAGNRFVGVETAVRTSRDGLILDHRLTIQHDSNVTIKQRDVVLLPLSPCQGNRMKFKQR